MKVSLDEMVLDESVVGRKCFWMKVYLTIRLLLGEISTQPRLDIKLWHVAVGLFVTIPFVPRKGYNPLQIV